MGRMPHGFLQCVAIVSRITALVAACIGFYAAVFLYEDQEGEWQNRLDAFWVSINDRAKITERTSTALFNRIAEVLRSAFDRIFGHKLFSFQSFRISLLLSVSIGFAVVLVILGSIERPIGIVMLLTIIILITLVAYDAVTHRWLSIPSWVLLFSLVTSSLGGVFLFPRILILVFIEAGVAIVVVLSFLSDVFVIAAVRALFNSIATTLSLVAIMLKMAGLIGLAFGVLSFPFIFFAIIPPLNLAVLLNVATALYCVIPLIMLAIVLLHKLLWPILNRLIYPLCRYKAISNKKAIVTISSLCALYAFGIEHIGLKEVLKLFS